MERKVAEGISSCCGSRPGPTEEVRAKRHLETPGGKIPAVETSLGWADRWKNLLVRCGIGRSSYSLQPGLYAVGNPGERSVVLVSANYKLSFDSLRKELGGLDAWILVLDTKGINVWCAAGKGTFSTEELVRRIDLTGLHAVVSHRTIILPQLSAPGVAAYEVKRQTGFRAVYGPVRARDIRQFIKDRMTATLEMRTVSFGLWERLAVVPADMLDSLKLLSLFVVVLGLVRLSLGGFSVHSLLLESSPFLGAFLIGTLAVPLLLPWIPVRAFVLKGWVLGTAWALTVSLIQHAGAVRAAGNLLLFPAIAAYFSLNFTGSTTFTSQTGVNKEIRLFARPMAVSGILGILLLIGGTF